MIPACLRPLSSLLRFALVAALLLAANSLDAAEDENEKRLFGFEEPEVAKMAETLKLQRKEEPNRDGKVGVSIWRDFLMRPWTLYEGEASEGDWAMGMGLLRDPADASFATRVRHVEEAGRYYGVTNGSGAFNTCGVFRTVFPEDWSEYDALRIDVRCVEAPHTFRMTLEDEEIAPPAMRTFTVEPEKWTTLEIDLRDAAEARGLDLRKMTTLNVGVVAVDGRVRAGHSALIDNIRLARKDAAAKFPVVRDRSPHDLPEYYRASSRPQPAKLPDPPDHSPLAAAKPIVIETETTAVVNPVGWVAAYDNDRLLVGYLEKNSVPPTNVYALQSLDGGKTWRGLDGGRKPSSFMIVGSDHGGGGGSVAGIRPDVFVLTNLGCRGGSFAALRLFAQQITFIGPGWELRELPVLVDCDLRHCNSNQSIVRTANGRLWAAYGLAGRMGGTCINVRYSDDEGLTWKSWEEGKSGAVPGLKNPPMLGWTYQFEEPCLVPFGKGIACIWQEIRSDLKGQVRWSRFEEGEWSPVERIETPRLISGNPTARPVLSAVSRGDSEIFLTGSRFAGILHYQDGKWTVEAEDVPRGSRIAIAGDKAVLAVAEIADDGNVYEGPATLRGWLRKKDGTWSARDLAHEELPLSNRLGGGDTYFYRPGFVVQPYSPPNCFPIAWTCEGQKWIKLLRVPVEAEVE